jgi:hypothetical protein
MKFLSRAKLSIYIVYLAILSATVYDDKSIYKNTMFFIVLFKEKHFREVEPETTCTFNERDLKDAFIFFPVHLINWFFASVLVRDFVLLHIWSIFDELIEHSYQPLIPAVFIIICINMFKLTGRGMLVG